MDLSSLRKIRDQAVQSLEEDIVIHKTDGSSVTSKGNFQAQERRVFFSLTEVDKIARYDLLERQLEPGQLWKIVDIDRQKTRAWVHIDKLDGNGEVIRRSEAPKTVQNFYGSVGNVAGTNYGSMTAYIKQNGDEITRLLVSLRKIAQEFPEAQREEVQVHLEDLAADLDQPEKCQQARLKTRIAGLFGVLLMLGGGVATATDFANNVLELSEKLDVPTETFQPQLEQLKQIYPGLSLY